MNAGSELRILTLLIIVAAFAATVIASTLAARAQRRGRIAFPLRPLSGAAAIPALVGTAVESDRPVHLSTGLAGIGGASTPLALAAAEAVYHVATAAAIGTRPALFTTAQSASLALGYGTLRRAYLARGRAEIARRFTRSQVQWLPNTDRALPFAAALTALETTSASGYVLAGSFGAEIALILEDARRRKAQTVAGSDQLEAQAVSFALADHALLGEEVFAFGAYLTSPTNTTGTGRARPLPASTQIGGLAALDTLRLLLILGLLAACALVLREPISVALSRLAGGN